MNMSKRREGETERQRARRRLKQKERLRQRLRKRDWDRSRGRDKDRDGGRQADTDRERIKGRIPRKTDGSANRSPMVLLWSLPFFHFFPLFCISPLVRLESSVRLSVWFFFIYLGLAYCASYLAGLISKPHWFVVHFTYTFLSPK